jgi:hypothetical protein
MSGLTCPHCGARIDIFGTGGGRKQAQEMSVSFLGALPMDIEARRMADGGKPVILENRDNHLSVAMRDIARQVASMFSDPHPS